jgi:uncharacterized protein YjiK
LALAFLTGAWVLPQHPSGPVLDRYDLSSKAGTEINLPRVLEEISGLVATPDGRLFAHHDERAVVYELDPSDGKLIKAFSVGVLGIPGDFEGIASAEGLFFMITSGGQLVAFREGVPGSSVRYEVVNTGLGRFCELEGLAFDSQTRALLIPCKSPKASDLKDHLVVFSLPLETMKPQEGTPRVFLPLQELKDAGLDDEFHPSAIEIHPETRSLIITAAREEALVEVGRDGTLLAVKELKRKDHPQPEGLAFLPDGTLIIADEGQGKRGQITRYSPSAASQGGGR